ncbi:CocE/NonD family hydrolase [Tomitella biformata]|uniref:CocE/NonD family hydrolase n=1 Tax=Tomitella biformata TaxID=630403 RepID=UPI0004B5C712|nr:CocE/NonD family hydrolase [Tomitella biformata]
MRIISTLSVTTAALLAFSAAAGSPAAAQGLEVAVQTLHFAVQVGPDDAATSCDIVGDLYRPTAASPEHPVAAILTTNGFGGSKNDQAPMARMLAGRGYAVLSYSGLGFGGSTCKVTLDDPRYDGKAASQLVDYLGGQDGIAFADPEHRQPLPGADFIARDSVDHRGAPSDHDPRVGMVGGSYGGQVQFAAASVDPRIDTIVPMITWHDLGSALAPNSLVSDSGEPTPGVTKAVWTDQLALAGMLSPGPDGYLATPLRALPCPNFTDEVCPALVNALLTGWPDQRAMSLFESVSVAHYTDAIAIPTLLIQGQNDTLFNLSAAQSTYDALAARGVEVKMIWQLGGHSGPPAPGELDAAAPDPDTQYVAGRIVDWFDSQLLGSTVDTGPAFAYFQDWVEYSGNAAPAFAGAADPRVGSPITLDLTGGDALRGLTTGVSGLPVPPDPGAAIPLPQFSTPGTTADWASEPLATSLTVVGAPTLDISLAADPGGNGSLERSTVVFAQIVDIGPDGAETSIHDLVAPIRVLNPGGPLHITLPPIVHRFEPGHRIGVSFAGGNAAFRGNLVSQRVEFMADAAQTLTLPVTP